MTTVRATHTTVSRTSAAAHSPIPADPFKDADTGLPMFNMYRKGLQLFVLINRDGHPRGMIWAGSAEAAAGRANSIVGSGAFVARANGSK
jgi:hypothetical protein